MSESGDFSIKNYSGETCIMPTVYLPTVNYYKVLLKHKKIIFDIHEHYHKQFYFNRCIICGANGILKLTIPVKKNHGKTPLKNTLISNDINWQTIHWRSIQAAYRQSPFFEFYEDELYPIFMEHKPASLVDWNLNIFNLINKYLNIDIKYTFTESYEKSYENVSDYRNYNSEKSNRNLAAPETPYHQVFQDRNGFIPNLSIIDLLFCEGYRAKEFLLE